MIEHIDVKDAAAHPEEVAPDFPNPVLASANWADAFEIETSRSSDSMSTLAAETVGAMPTWARILLGIRNAVVVPFGLKGDGLKDVASPEKCIDIFPILEDGQDRIVLGLDDKHLDFRIILERANFEQSSKLRLTTLVARHNLFGRIYIAAITPFHRMIVRSVLCKAA